MSRIVSFLVLMAITLLISLLFYRVLAGFLIPVFLAIVLVVVFQPLHRWMLRKFGNHSHVAAGLTTFAIVACLLLPVGILVGTAAVQGIRFFQNNSVSSLELQFGRLRSSLDLDLPHWGEVLRTANADVEHLVQGASIATLAQSTVALPELTRKVVRVLNELRRELAGDASFSAYTPQIDELIELAKAIGVQPTIKPADNSDNNGDPSDASLTELVLKLKTQFGTLKTQLHGGALRSFLREMANPTAEDMEAVRRRVLEYVQPRLVSFTQSTGMITFHLVFGLLVLSLSTYFFLVDGPAMIHSLMLLLPMDMGHVRELLDEFVRTSRAVVLATLLAALAQGLTAGVGYAVAGIDYLVLLIMLTSIAALIPFVGPMAVWVPICIFLALVEQRYLAAGLLAAWGLLVVATIDNFVKAFVLHGQSQLHPLLALLSILGGIQALGPIGIVVGPMAVSLLQTLLSIVRRELVHFDTHGLAPVGGAAIGTTAVRE
ncbi:MAG: AI-2E family transporter [Pirellulaceae bacterium]|nr:AI-2E family transporter [Pirellulaceae bacterium]